MPQQMGFLRHSYVRRIFVVRSVRLVILIYKRNLFYCLVNLDNERLYGWWEFCYACYGYSWVVLFGLSICYSGRVNHKPRSNSNMQNDIEKNYMYLIPLCVLQGGECSKKSCWRRALTWGGPCESHLQASPWAITIG